MKVIRLAIILTFFVLAACGKKKPDPAQQLRAFMADWERAVDAKNPEVLDSLLTTAKNVPPIDPRQFLAEIYSAEGITRVNLVGRQLDIGEKQATVTGRLVRSGISDSLTTLSLSLLRVKSGWKLAAYQLRPFEPARQDTAGKEPPN
ncbi:MAG TPA: hypothetical protein VNL73_04985 [Verrucomicrobiae bacterium]|nr:hypothetical protein [Verrucomicrobiae bacterium]